MCNFLSGLTFGPKLENRFGAHYANPATTDHHSVLEIELGLKDRHDDPHWAKWEFTPGPIIADFDSYTFALDERRVPSWWTDEHKRSAIAYAKTKLAEVVLISGVHEIKTGRFWLTGTAVVSMRGGTLKAMYGGTLEVMDGGTLEVMYGGTLEVMDGGTLKAMYGGTLKAMYGGTLKPMYGGTLEVMDGGTLKAMRGGTLKAMRGGTLEAMYGGTLEVMDGGTLKAMYGGTLEVMDGGTLKSMRGGTLEVMYGGTLEVMDGGTLKSMRGYHTTVILYDGDLPLEIRDRAVVVDRRDLNSPVIAQWTDGVMR